MFFVYVLKSLKTDYYYKGHCECLEKRLVEHNQGKTKSNKAFAPFEMVFYETFDSREEAIRREKYFKSVAGRRYLQSKINVS